MSAKQNKDSSVPDSNVTTVADGSAGAAESNLERHVDAMMDTKLPDEQPITPSAPLFTDIGAQPPEPKTASTDTELPTEANAAPSAHEVADADPLSDPTTDALVDDILVRESDELLAARDARLEQPAGGLYVRPTLGMRIKSFFASWWHNKYARYGTILLLVVGLGGLAAMPTSRYYAMNAVGVRSAASLTILDKTTQQPLKNVTVKLGERTAKTNQDGIVKLSELPLGVQSLAVSQAGFSTISRTVTLGWGSNPLGEFSLEAVGRQFRFKLTDYLSNKPVKDAEISRGDANAQADKAGEIVLTIDQNEPGDAKATIRADGYRSEAINLDNGQKQSQTITMVPSQKEVYITKQSGKYDLYKIDIDGKNKEVLLAASGHEDNDIAVVQHGSGDQVALVSRRDTTKNQDGYPLQSLTIVDVSSGRVLNLDRSERIQIVDWIGDRLVYVKIKAGTSAGNPERYQLVSYDYQAAARIQLASANYFNDVLSAKGNLYYAASNNYQGGNSQFVKILADNTGKQILLDKTDVWNIARTSYDMLNLSVMQGTFGYKIGDPSVKKSADSMPAFNETRFYLDAPDGKRSLWTETRDGKGVLIAYNASTGKDVTLASQSGLTYPVRWLNDRTIVYRVTTPSETADYAISLDGGAAKKIVDVTGTAGLGRWNYR
ncbi:MAG TPA: hypothetical protein VF575_04645 [Candidatus Saccharimonadales bacterium]|jgi:hypothetical protein